MEYKAIISDAGDILFSTNLQKRKKRKLIRSLLEQSTSKINIDKAIEKFKPYNCLAQTTNELWESFISFTQNELDLQIDNEDAKKMENDLLSIPNELFNGVPETLEKLREIEMPLIILTNGPKPGVEYDIVLRDSIKRRISSFQDYSKYVHAQISSKDLGARKPDPSTFHAAYLALDIAPKKNEILYLAHSQSEIFAAANFGFSVVACKYQQQKDAKKISNAIKSYNKTNALKIIEIKEFKDLISLIDD